jgi:hypothetical protein
MAPVDLSTLPSGRSPFQYTRRDSILYAVAEGASFDDHKWVRLNLLENQKKTIDGLGLVEMPDSCGKGTPVRRRRVYPDWNEC